MTPNSFANRCSATWYSRVPDLVELMGLLNTFNENGPGEVMSSWIGKGENLPISPEQIQQVLGSGQVQQIAEKLGVSPDEASSGLD